MPHKWEARSPIKHDFTDLCDCDLFNAFSHCQTKRMLSTSLCHPTMLIECFMTFCNGHLPMFSNIYSYFKSCVFFCLVTTYLIFTGCGKDSASDWAGVYVYKDPASEHFELTLYDDGQCQLKVEGKRQDLIICHPTFSTKKMAVKFSLYAPGATTGSEPPQAKENYDTNATLFELEKADGQQVMTHWKALIPDGTHANSGDFFSKR